MKVIYDVNPYVIRGFKNGKLTTVEKTFKNYSKAYTFAIEYFDEVVMCKENHPLLGLI